MTREACSSGLALLCAALRHQHTPQLVSAFMLALEDKLSDDEWGRKVQEMLQTRTSSFWPPPGAFLVDPDAEAADEVLALQVWVRIGELVRQTYGAARDFERFCIAQIDREVGPDARSVVELFGGATAVRDADAISARYMTRDFVRLYPVALRRAAEDARKALEAGRGDASQVGGDRGVRRGVREAPARGRRQLQGAPQDAGDSAGGGDAPAHLPARQRGERA